MRILITGASGQVGHALAERLNGAAEVMTPTRRDFDLAALSSLGPRLQDLAPTLIVNCAAYTAVDRAEDERDLALTVNAQAVGALGAWAAACDCPLVHLSTDYVFDGEAQAPYREADTPRPLSVYGASKAEGERQLLDSGAPCLIVRTSWVYGPTGKNFLRTILKLACERTELSVVNDQTGAPTSAAQIAEFVARLALLPRETQCALFEKAARVVHFTASGSTTWHGFASAIVTGAERYGFPVRTRMIQPISSANYPTAARRPAFSRLSLERLERVFDVRPARWEDALDDVLKAMSAAIAPQETSPMIGAC